MCGVCAVCVTCYPEQELKEALAQHRSFRNSKANGFGWLETVQEPAPTECFIAVWKCLFSEHKFKGQIQGMSRNKAYHHVS